MIKDNRWVPPHASSPPHIHREHALSLRTYAHMQRLHAAHPGAAGITFLKGIEYLEAPGPEYLELDPSSLRLPGHFRLLEPSEFPDDRVRWGCEYDTWCVNPMVYCCFLLRRFALRGGTLLRRELRAPEEAFSLSFSSFLDSSGTGSSSSRSSSKGPVAAVVNASGFGLGGPEGDRAMFVTRGQTCLVAEPCSDATVTRQNADGSWAFCVPRGFDGGTVVGGTKEPGAWAAEPSAAVRDELLARLVRTYPRILDGSRTGRLTVLRDIVGRRPTRVGGPRIEGEVLARERGGGFVMHAYGLGGRGYELSWGVAEEVVEGVRRYLEVKEAAAAKL